MLGLLNVQFFLYFCSYCHWLTQIFSLLSQIDGNFFPIDATWRCGSFLSGMCLKNNLTYNSLQIWIWNGCIPDRHANMTGFIGSTKTPWVIFFSLHILLSLLQRQNVILQKNSLEENQMSVSKECIDYCCHHFHIDIPGYPCWQQQL